MQQQGSPGDSRLRRRRVQTPAGVELELMLAESFRARTVGLLGDRGLPERTALLIPRCRSVHTIGMRFSIDVAFARLLGPDGALEIVYVSAEVRPGRFARVRGRSNGLRRRELCALELATGQAEWLGLTRNTRLEPTA